MKPIFIIFLGLFATFSFSQEVKVQKEFLTLPKTDLVNDFNLKVGSGNIVPITVSKATYKDIGFSFVGHKFQYMKGDYSLETLTFQNKKLRQSTTQYNYGNFMKPQGFKFMYTYDSKGNVSKRTSKASDSDYISETFYTYSNNKISKTRETGAYADGKKYDKIINYKHEGNSISYDFENGKKTFSLKNNLITTETTFNKSANKTYINTYKYNTNGILINQDRGAYQATYTLTDKNQIAKEVNKTYTQTFEYVYDKYGNWVIAYPLSISISNKKLYGSQFSYYIREIKYSNGDVTGSVNPDNDVTKTYVVNIRKELYDRLAEPNVSFRRTANSSYLFKINSQQEAKNTNSAFINRSLLVFHKPSKQLYLCEDFADKAEGKDFSAKKVNVTTKNGYWYRIPKGGVHVFLNDGTYIDKTQVFEYAPNNKDVFFKGEKHTEKVVLTGYRTATSYTVYPVTLHADYKNTSSNTMTDSAEKLAKSLDEYSEYYTGECVKGDCKDGYGEKEFKDGKTAHGFFKDGKVYGPIHTASKNNKKSMLSVYKGSFLDQEGFAYEYNGDNLMIFTDKSKNIGFYNDYKTKKTYRLNYSNGKVISKRELSNNNSSTCVVGNCSNGVGIYEYGNSTYLGTFKNGKRDGFGMLFFKSGGDYIGEFSNGNFHGLGTYTRSEYDYYMGYYQNGKQHGQGVQYFTKDRYNAGNWVNGKLEGKTTASNTTTNITAVTSFSNEEKNAILACKNDSKCVANYFESLQTRESKKVSGEALKQKMTDYFHSVYKLNPKLAFDILFKIDISIIDIKSLPQAVQNDLKARAQKISDGYQEHVRKQGH